jgi:hypothetical protein
MTILEYIYYYFLARIVINDINIYYDNTVYKIVKVYILKSICNRIIEYKFKELDFGIKFKFYYLVWPYAVTQKSLSQT